MAARSGGYIANAEIQPQSCINMLNFLYLWFPFIMVIIMIILLYSLKVEKANEDWMRSMGKSKKRLRKKP